MYQYECYCHEWHESKTRSAHCRHIAQPRLYIPTEQDYGVNRGPWVEKVEAELLTGKRHALLTHEGAESLAVVVFRQNPDATNVIDIRNISVNPDVRHRHFGSFLLHNTDHVISEVYPTGDTLMVDTKATNEQMISFLLTQGYTEAETADLYDSGKPDIVFRKQLNVAA